MIKYSNKNKFMFEEGEDYTNNEYLDEINFSNQFSIINDNEYEVDSDSDLDDIKETDI